MKKALFVLGIALFAATGAVYAYPSLLGPTGGANLPTAAVEKTGQLEFALDYVQEGDRDIIGSPAVNIATREDLGDTKSLRMLYGLLPGMEIGGKMDFEHWNTSNVDLNDGSTIMFSSSDYNLWGANAKYQLPFQIANLTWAVGGEYNRIPTSTENWTQGYAVGSFPCYCGTGALSAIRCSVGGNWTRYRETDEDYSEDDTRGFLSIDLAFANKWSLIGEYQSTTKKDASTHPLTSLVARTPLGGRLAGQVGVTNGENGGLFVGSPISIGYRHYLFAGLEYSLGN